jgi:large subunit ribosomal protein L10
MTRSRKQEIVENLTAEFTAADAIIACDFKGITVTELEDLRVAANAADVKVQVVKNKLAALALKAANAEGIELKENNIFIWGNDPVGASKVSNNFAKTNDKLVIKAGFVDGEPADAARIAAFAALPGREELLGMLAATWMAPVANFTIGLDALRRQKEEA